MPGSPNSVYDHLIGAIREGTYGPGDRIREGEVAKELGLSRTPVRDALRRLESRGLLVHEPHRGMVVRTLDHRRILELYFMREVLDGAAAELAARNAVEVELEMLDELLAADRERVESGRSVTHSNLDYHDLIYRMARNGYLNETLEVLRTAMILLGPSTLDTPERARQAIAEHEAVVAAIRARDPEAASQAAKRHIRSALKARMSLSR